MVPVAGVLSYGIHIIIVSNRFTAFLFNGVWPTRKREELVIAAPLAGNVAGPDVEKDVRRKAA